MDTVSALSGFPTPGRHLHIGGLSDLLSPYGSSEGSNGFCSPIGSIREGTDLVGGQGGRTDWQAHTRVRALAELSRGA